MLRQRSISAVAVVVATVIPAFFGGPLFLVTIAAIAVSGLHELLRALSSAGFRVFRVGAFVALTVLFAATVLNLPGWAVAGLITLTVLGQLGLAVLQPPIEQSLLAWALCSATTLYVGLPLGLTVALRDLSGLSERGWVNRLTELLGSGSSAVGLSWFALAVTITWLTDTAAYLVGRSRGRVKLVPQLSPGKTREGAIGGVIAGGLGGLLAVVVFGTPISLPGAVLAGLLLSVIGQMGDLAESLLKRNLQIKDMGSLIPGHGGILDRIDALLFTLPAAFLLAHLAQETNWL